MKKYLSMILAVAIAAMLSISVFADRTEASVNVPGDQEIPVKLDMNGTTIGHRYSIDIAYTGNMTFTYVATGVNWVVGDDSYSYSRDAASWQTSTQTVTITNHSDLALGYTVSMEKAAKYAGLTFTLSNATNTLDACTVNTPYGTIAETVNVAVAGDIPGTAVSGDSLGLLTIAFEAR